MYKKFSALIFLLLMCSTSYGASNDTIVYEDPYNLYFWYVNSADEAGVYDRYGNGDYNFFYQLRDVTGAVRNDRVAGPQWFATVYENYYRNIFLQDYDDDDDPTIATGIYRRTMGGEIPEITFSNVGDILDGFNFVFAEEPQPYETAWRRYISNGVYDIYPDPLESFCLVITNGQGEFNVSLGNPYARHFPFWWNYGYVDSKTSSKWWQRYNDWRDNTYSTMEPVEYICSGMNIYHRTANGRYDHVYTCKVSEDVSGDAEMGVYDLSGTKVYTLSGDVDGVHYWLDSEKNIAYTVSEDKIYNSGGTLTYTIENKGNQDQTGDLYICAVREVYEQVTFSDFDENYTLSVTPADERPILSGNYLDANVRVRGIDPYNYGSKLGYIVFKQRANFATGYSNYRQSTLIPMVIANVSSGNASDNPLMFDMLIFSQTNDIVNRIKFTWDAQRDMPDQDLGTFFMMRQFNATTSQLLKLETRITNRTGTRYELYRYDEIGSRTGDAEYRDSYRRIMPDYWKYDITPDLYGTLPDHFLLDAHSQIAPGLVTVYKSNVGEGYRTIDIQYDTSESFRLYEYSTTSPKNLRLNYKRVAGMTTATGAFPNTYNGLPASSNDKVILQGFNMQFADIVQDENETEYQLTKLMGKPPAMVPAEQSTVAPLETYIRSSALNAFTISRDVPPEMHEIVAYSEDQTVSDDTKTELISERAALQPVYVRLRIPRQYRLINEIWNELDSASNSRQLFERFANHGAIWVRSSATREQDTNLFSALNNKGANIGVSASDCIKAFLYNDELYLDFIVFIADAKSTNAGRTAYVEIFKDDNVPYMLIGDGAVDMKWDLTFFVDATGDNPATRDPEIPDTPTDNRNTESKSGGGGGCNSVIFGAVALMVLFRRKR